MKKIFLLFISLTLLLNIQVLAQSVKYTEHTLVEGETLSQLASKYKTTVGDIMRLNGMHADSKLVVGQKIKIPSAGQTVVRPGDTKTKPAPTKSRPDVVTTTKPAAEPVTKKNTSAALTHVVQPKETMYSISKKYGITVDQLQQWNYKKDYNLEDGELLAVNVNGIPEAVKKRKELSEQKPVTAVPDQTPPLVVKDTIKVDNVSTSKAEQQTSNDIKDETKEVAVKQEEKTTAPPPFTAEPKKDHPVTNAASDGTDNFFAKNFSASGKSENANGTAMIFKTASGWNDKKYYVLMNEAPSGSVVKIRASNGNIVYAKVLWKLDDMKQNKGLQFRISEAAAAALNVQGDKFPLTVQYYQ
jgi:LysM repeat protein